MCSNRSDLPVFDLMCVVGTAEAAGKPFTPLHAERRSVFPGGSEIRIPLPGKAVRDHYLAADPITIVMTFRDASDQEWRRDEQGYLTERAPDRA